MAMEGTQISAGHDPPGGAPRHAVPVAERLVSVDVFRGATIAAILLVDGQGGTIVFAMFTHSEWSGLTFTDRIAPSFMWVVGVGLYISLNKQQFRGDGAAAIFLHALRRAAILFAIGVSLNLWLPALTAIGRWNAGEQNSWILLMGTLQRIAVGYLIANMISLATRQSLKADCSGHGAFGGLYRVFLSGLRSGVFTGGFQRTRQRCHAPRPAASWKSLQSKPPHPQFSAGGGHGPAGKPGRKAADRLFQSRDQSYGHLSARGRCWLRRGFGFSGPFRSIISCEPPRFS